MNRCTTLPKLHSPARRVALIAALLGLSFSASAQHSVRPFPANALRGTMQVTHPPELLLDGRPARLSPGARIRAENNLLVMSGTLVGKSLVVNYVRDPQGMLHDVWVLNATEALQPLRGAAPLSNSQSDNALSSQGAGVVAAPATGRQQQ